jgi:NAD(P)-dependent dehydrogenase (short-subunit alcohol dehydrogenase family)
MARKKLQGQVAIITGASRGIGAAAAALLAESGASLVLTARSGEAVESLAADLRRQGARAVGVAADVADPEQVEEVVESALDQFGRVDVLLNNAAVIWPLEEVADTDADEWTYSIQVNLLGPFSVARNVLPVMVEQRYGRIINLGSGAGQHPIVGASAYCVAKAGLDMFTRVLSAELAGTGVTVTCLDPGMVDTEMQSDIRSVDTSETKLDFTRWHAAHEEGRLASPEEVARLVLWLAGPWSRKHAGTMFARSDVAWIEQVNADLGA